MSKAYPFIKSAEQLAKFETDYPGVLTPEVKEGILKRIAKETAKPTVPNVSLEIVTGTAFDPKTGEEVKLGLFIETKTSKWGSKFVGAEFRYSTAKSWERAFLPNFQGQGKTLTQCLVQAVEALEAQGVNLG